MNQSEKPILSQESMTVYQRQRCGQRFKKLVLKVRQPE